MTTVIAVTSAKGGNGKSTVALLVAAAASAFGRRVVLADMDYSAPAQTDRNRVRFSEVPGRMPTVVDDSHVGEWHREPEAGLLLVPGARFGRDRRPEIYGPAGLRLVERARRVMDVVVLDLHQIVGDEYTKMLVESADVVVTVTDHDAISRDNLRPWLDRVTGESDERLPSVDPDAVRLVYSEGVPLARKRSDERFVEAQAAMSRRYRWAGRISFDAGIVDGGNAGEFLDTISDATEAAGVEVASSLLDIEAPSELLSGSRRLFKRRTNQSPFELVRERHASAAVVAVDQVASVGQVDAGTEVVAGPNVVRLLGRPAVHGVDVPAVELGVIACAVAEGPMSVTALAERVEMTERQVIDALEMVPAVVEIDAGLVFRAPGVTTDVTRLRELADAVQSGASNITEAATTFRSVPGPPVVGVSGDGWRWAFVEHGEHEAFVTAAMREISVCASQISTAAAAAGPAEMAAAAEALEIVAPRLGPGGGAVHAAAQRLRTALASSPVDGSGVSWPEPVPAPWWPGEANDPAEAPTLAAEPVWATAESDRGATTEATIVDCEAPVPGNDQVPSTSTETAPDNLGQTVTVAYEGASQVASGAAQADALRWERPRVWLRTMCGEPRVDGAMVSGVVPLPFLLASARSALAERKIAELTGFAAKSIRNAFPVGSPVVEREAGQLLLAEGVWTDFDWVAECARRVGAASSDVDRRRWAYELVERLQEAEHVPFERVPQSRRGSTQNPWAWVDEFPLDVSAFQQASRVLIEAVGAVSRSVVDDDNELRCAVANAAVKVARWAPNEPVSWTHKSSGAALLVLAAHAASCDREALEAVQYATRVMVNDKVVEADAELVEAVGF